MQTSLGRRERHRRNGHDRHRGGGAGSKIAIILPLLLLSTLVVLAGVGFVGAMDAYAYYSQGLEDPKALLEHLDFNQQTVLYDRTGSVELARYGAERREVLTYEQLPASVIDTTTSTEDKTFWTNPGFDPHAVLSAFMDALSGKPRGASTITQQLVRKSLLPPSQSTEERKIKEIIQSIRLTDEYQGKVGKQKILTAYLNLNFYGNQSYGIQAAAEGYFGVTDLRQLTLAQAAILSGILQQPSGYDLMANAEEQPDGSLVVPNDATIVQRRNWVLDQLRQNQQERLLVGTYTDAEITAAQSEPVVLHPPAARQNLAPHFDVQVRNQLAALLCGADTAPGDCEELETGGYKVVTTIDLKMQASAEKWLKAYILAPNMGSRTTMNSYLDSIGVKDSFNLSRIRKLFGAGQHNGALIAIDYRTGQVLAYAGSAGFYEKPVRNPKSGRNFFDPQFDVLMGYRQPGSSFKPVNYTTAFDDHTLTAASLLMDVGTDFGGGYHPHDADRLERGPLRVREALQYSLNIPAVKAAQINGVQHLMQRAQDFGIKFLPNISPGVSIGIGTVEVRPADLVGAYGAIANGGVLMDRQMILSVTDSHGNQVYPTPGQKPKSKKVVGAGSAYVMTSILSGNTDPNQNIWWGQYHVDAKVNGKTVRRPATLKTGTTDETEDLLAAGYTAAPADTSKPAIAALAWVGNSDHSVPKSGVMSLDLAAPLWHAFLQEITASQPVTDFKQPSGVTWATIDAYSGMLPGPYTTKTLKEVFVNGTVPTQVDNTKVPMDVDAVSGKLWADGCTGVKETRGFLDLSKVDAGNANWQKYDAIWIARAKKGVGVAGGPNGGRTAYFFRPYGGTWGAPFPPTDVCSGPPEPTPPPSGSQPPGPTPTPVPSPTATRTAKH